MSDAEERVEIRVLYDFDEGDQTYKQGEFIKVAPAFADELIEDKLAEKKTREEVEAETTADQEKSDRDRRRASRVGQRTGITRVHDNVTDDPTGGYGEYGFGTFCQDVKAACRHGAPTVSNKLGRWDSVAKTNMITADDSQGGYLVPPEFLNTLYKNSLEAAVAWPRTRQFPMQTNRITLPAVVDNSHETTTYGGITLYRPGEDEIKTNSKPTFRQIELTAHKLIGMVHVSDELLEDSPMTVATIITELFADSLAWQRDRDVLRGTGVNQPLGVLNAGCLVAQAIEPLQPADTVVIENVVNMWSRLFPPSQRNAVWLCNNTVLPQLYLMGLAVGTGGSAVFMPPGAASASPYASLMGRPLIPTEKLPTVGDQGDLLLADFSAYATADKGGIKSDSSMHLYFNYDRTAFRFVFRGDGQPLWNAPLTPNAGETLSPFVVLAERA